MLMKLIASIRKSTTPYSQLRKCSNIRQHHIISTILKHHSSKFQYLHEKCLYQIHQIPHPLAQCSHKSAYVSIPAKHLLWNSLKHHKQISSITRTYQHLPLKAHNSIEHQQTAKFISRNTGGKNCRDIQNQITATITWNVSETQRFIVYLSMENQLESISITFPDSSGKLSHLLDFESNQISKQVNRPNTSNHPLLVSIMQSLQNRSHPVFSTM